MDFAASLVGFESQSRLSTNCMIWGKLLDILCLNFFIRQVGGDCGGIYILALL